LILVGIIGCLSSGAVKLTGYLFMISRRIGRFVVGNIGMSNWKAKATREWLPYNLIYRQISVSWFLRRLEQLRGDIESRWSTQEVLVARPRPMFGQC
jgi:hypothetical protein